jgi:hypothetical protein
MMGMKVGSVMGFLSGGAMLSFLGIGILGLTWPSRVISRLSLVRSRPAAGSTTAETTTFIRMQHQGHEMMWGRFAQPRDIPLEQVCVKVILGRPMKNGERGECEAKDESRIELPVSLYQDCVNFC